MRLPFERPFFATFFFWYAGLSTVFGLLAVFVFPASLVKLVGPELGLLLQAGIGMMVILTLAQGVATASIGYVIELIAKIEWNTRPDVDEWGGAVARSKPAQSAKQYYYIADGPLHGPFSAPAILDLYRVGKVPNNARLYVEEAGNRRPLSNWSEIGV